MTWRLVYVPEPAVRLPVYVFDQQRAKCLQCCNVRRRFDTHPDGGHAVMTCAIGSGTHSCSAMRAEGGRCGPEARLFNREPPARIDGRSKRRVLTPEVVQEMRANPEGLSVYARAKRAGVSDVAARNAINRVTFKDVA